VRGGLEVTRLAGKVALITGGGTGIGKACSRMFVREGARVAVAGRRREPLEALVNEITAAKGEALAVQCDVTNRAQVERAVRETVTRFGGLHCLVNNAGALLVGTVEDTSDEDWARVIGTNLTGTFLVSRAALPELRRAGGGTIVNIASVLGLVGLKGRAAYTASKTGVVGLTRALAMDHAAEGIRVNCICPALVETEMVRGLYEKQADPQAAMRARLAMLPLGRLGKPEDVANMVVFLASEESSWLTGAALPLDGGLTAY
jgi:NAD(P)-dependent dehydrogenase (short-subunit alcohol dehydrogenase family)